MAKQAEGSAEKLLKEFGQKIDELIEKGKHSSKDIRDDLDGTSEEIKKLREKAEEEILKFRQTNKEAIKEIQAGLGRAGAELKKTFKTVFKTKKKGKKKGKKK
ncbi:MAG: hypothetical protein O7F74_06100 [Bacteroidetes bacterium]|nr:hypothetical protein [Bacteroidota bacterium]